MGVKNSIQDKGGTLWDVCLAFFETKLEINTIMASQHSYNKIIYSYNKNLECMNTH